MSDATVACLTPPGRGAIAVLAVEGAGAEGVLRQIVASRHGVADMPVGGILVGRLGGASGEEVVVARLEPLRWELSCHGGTAAVEVALQRCEAAGARRVEPAAWIEAHAADRLMAEAAEDLAAAPTLRTAALLLDQQQGALARALDALGHSIRQGDAPRAARLLAELLERAPLGLRLTRAWRVALIGRPNVGKSSLLNALAGYERAVTHHQPGTTRDVLTVQAALEGWPIELADTAGQRVAADLLEAAGTALARAAARQCDLVVLVSDGSQPWSRVDDGLASEFAEALVVHNKCDLPAGAGPRPAGIATSATRGLGIDRLAASIVARFTSLVPQPGAAIPFRAAHVAALRDAQKALAAGDWDSARVALHRLRRR